MAGLPIAALKIVGVSATIPNLRELGGWLGASR